MSDNTADTDSSLTILDLPSIVTLLYARAQRPLLPGAQRPLGLFVRYLRRKPARGLAVIYKVDEMEHGKRAQSNDPNRSVSLTLDEQALDGTHIRFTKTQAQKASLEVQATGVLRADDIGLSVQAFPADGSLPALADSCDTSRHSPLFEALQFAARVQLGDDSWQLVSASAEPIRYKPANRCVICYHLILEHSKDKGASLRNLAIFGKVYADPEQARSVQALQQQLYDEQTSRATGVGVAQSMEGTLGINLSGNSPLLPRPLGLIDALGLTFNQAIEPGKARERLVTGARALRPHMERGRGGEITELVIPSEELRLTAIALARLHTSAVRPDVSAPRMGAKEAKRARERAELIASHNPAQAEEVQRLGQQLATHLETLQPDTYRPAHGGFKASQLLFHSHQVFVVDFDGFCLADPALDVGYFLAYLRPSGLWYQRPGMRQWFEAAAEVFAATYRKVLSELGVAESEADNILQRSRLYEAALLFKIAARRANRLNSPRPKELSAILSEIATCFGNT